ncbi:hypothetical protein ABD87_14830 [Lysinibacillus sphaericus]|uniref:hypothetical protein n=1 Tax=Lysinibacillus sphaericus TaxID=1421 RepID=UPI0018CDFA8C|nr:hypothetical protein [Lysinibacillus sphaericus]MBG9730771.1 hypothetical protein [Lysinibacillus sphaericus]
MALKNSEQGIYQYENEEFDFDRYCFVTCSQISTKETSVIVDFKTNEIYGDRIAYGSWYDIEWDDCIELLKTLEPHEILRDFSSLINQYEQRKN